MTKTDAEALRVILCNNSFQMLPTFDSNGGWSCNKDAMVYKVVLNSHTTRSQMSGHFFRDFKTSNAFWYSFIA